MEFSGTLTNQIAYLHKFSPQLKHHGRSSSWKGGDFDTILKIPGILFNGKIRRGKVRYGRIDLIASLEKAHVAKVMKFIALSTEHPKIDLRKFKWECNAMLHPRQISLGFRRVLNGSKRRFYLSWRHFCRFAYKFLLSCCLIAHIWYLGHAWEFKNLRDIHKAKRISWYSPNELIYNSAIL